MFSSILILVFCGHLQAVASDRDSFVPAFKLRVTSDGLDYVNEVASVILNQEIRSLRIENIYDNGTIVRNIRVNSFVATDYSYTLSPPSNLSWGLNQADIELRANINGCKKLLVNVCQSLDVVAGANAVSFRLTAEFGRQKNSSDRPAIIAADCRASIGSLELRVRGGVVGWIINLFRTRLARKLKPQVEKALCQKAKQFLLDRVNAKLASFPVQANVGRSFSLDYGLVSDLAITADHMEVALKGQITELHTNTSASPYPPNQMASSMRGNRMLYAWASEKIINDLLYQAHVSNLTQILLTDKTPGFGPRLKLICENATKCLGSRLPELADMFPSKVEAAEVFLTTTAPPFVQISDGTARLNVNGTMDLYVMVPKPGNTTVKQSVAFSTIGMTASLRIAVENMRLIGQVNITELNVRIVETKLDFFTVMAFEEGVSSMMTKAIEKSVNTRFSTGLPVPVTKGVHLVNPKILLLERTVQIESDLVYVREEEIGLQL